MNGFYAAFWTMTAVTACSAKGNLVRYATEMTFDTVLEVNQFCQVFWWVGVIWVGGLVMRDKTTLYLFRLFT